MIEQQRYCVDILLQVKAAKAALTALEKKIIDSHVDHCLSEAIHSTASTDRERALAEVKELLHSAR